jgi:hypothetical protein
VTAAPVSRPVGHGERRSAPVALVALVFVVVVLGLYGAEVAFGILRSGAPAPHAPAIGVPLATSFGSVTVEHAQAIEGLTARDMWNGMTHGIQDLVGPDEAQVAVAVHVFNGSDRAVAFDAGQFRLLAGGRTGPGAAPSATTILPLQLAPGTEVRGTLVFVTPLAGVDLSLVYADPAGEPITVQVGSLDAPPGDAAGREEAPHDE